MRNKVALLAVLLAILTVSATGSARSTSDPFEVREPDDSKAASAQRANTSVQNEYEGHDGRYWFDRGYQLHQSERYVDAIEAFSHSIGLGYRQATSLYNVACGFAMLDDKENALFWLDRAFATGFDRTDLLKSDSDLDALRSDPRFKEIVQRVSATRPESRPAKHKEQRDRDRLDEAIIGFEQLRSSSSQDGDQWYKVGSRLIRLREFDRAIVALTRAVELLGYRGSSAMYNLACTYALKGDIESGLQWLERSVNAGFDDPHKLEEDSDIASLRNDPRFKKTLELSRVLSLSQFNNDGSGDSQYSKSRWAPAVRQYESFLRSQPNNGRAWFNLGYALHYSREHTKAIDAFHRAIEHGYRQPTSMYNIACANAMMGNKDAAFEWLDKSVNAGFDVGGYIENDEDLDSLRSDPRFRRFTDIREPHSEKHKSQK
ncbi:MAG TPA: tetratricopeptide repeat protein [Blastocatellia bacterium]|nr:tetratricopeptide repeat protein [Blastocatellia bacterium]